ncbi:hypothetical protein ACMDCR_09380 [Labrys okinawensis]
MANGLLPPPDRLIEGLVLGDRADYGSEVASRHADRSAFIDVQ